MGEITLRRKPYWLLVFPAIFLLLIYGLSGKVGSYSTSQTLSSSIYAYFTGHPLPEKYQNKVDDVLAFLRKPAHVTLYGLFALSIFLCIKRLISLPVLQLQLLTLGICVICASFDELYQYLNKGAGRTGLVSDVVVDFLAAFVALGLYDIWKRRIK